MVSFFLKQKMYIFMIIMSETLCRDVIQIIWQKFNLILVRGLIATVYLGPLNLSYT